MTDKTFTIGGVSKSKNGYKVRFANGMMRVKILAKNNTDIELLQLPVAMTKPEVVTYLKSTDLYQNPAYQEAIDLADVKYNKATSIKVKGNTSSMLDDIKGRARKTAEVE